MRRQGAAVCPAAGSAGLPLARRALFGFGLAGRLDLFGLLQAGIVTETAFEWATQ
jgi:hypothetical protein